MVFQYADFMKLPSAEDKDDAAEENAAEEEEMKLKAAMLVENSLGIKVCNFAKNFFHCLSNGIF